jgi:two-component system, chemotaxis family, sensor kinase Cph1
MWQWLLQSGFMPHGFCYQWRPDILWMHVVSDAVVALAYFSIPITLIYFLRHRQDIPFRWLIGLFAAFIILCGLTHVFGIWTVWQPVYGLEGLVKALTALVSIFTAMALVPIIPEALKLRSPAELEAANRQLEAEVESRRAAERRLEEVVENLYRSNEELEQFAYIASHDLQAPLRTVVSFSGLLQQECKGRLSPNADEYCQYIVDGGVRMQALINDLLQLSRVNRDTAPPAPVSMGEALGDATRQLQALVRDRGAVIEAGALPVVMGNPVQLSQLLQNLLANAIKYQPAGQTPRIRISADRRGDDWHFVIEDNGIGIPEKHLQVIFEIFRRLHTDDQYPGTGIGLSLCKKIVARHGGRIWVESEPGRGSRFHFTLRAVDAHKALRGWPHPAPA